MSDAPRQKSPALGGRPIRPASDENIDPITSSQIPILQKDEAEVRRTSSRLRRPPATVTIQMNVRISIQTRAQLESICDRDDINMRTALERAIEAYAK